jgi:aminopeptidase N
MRFLAVCVALTMLKLTSAAAALLDPGVSLELAQWRAKNYKDLRYGLQMQVAEGAERLQGTLDLSVVLPARKVDLVLDWRGAPLRDLRVNGKPVAADVRNEHLVIDKKHLKSGANRVRLAFDSPIAVSGAAVTRYKDREDNEEYLYTLLVPADASTLFPCFDQPDLKGRFTLELSLPRHWKAVSNSPEARKSEGKVSFKETEPISTYLFAFAAGPFEALRETGDPVRMFVRRSRIVRGVEHAAEVLRLNREATAYFARYFARKFPFAKYDLVLLPEFPYGGMEHAGATFLNEERVLFPAPPSAADLLRRAQLIFHETSHQWFGDLVTMRWFDDLWLKEGFANFMAAKANEAILPQYDAWIAFHALKTSAVRTDATRGTTAIRYPLQNLADAKSAYGAIVYSKGPAVLRQAEFYLGEKVFQRAVRDFVKRHAYSAAGWQDLVAAFERASGKKLDTWAHAWVQRRGMPTVRYSNGQLQQTDSLGEGGLWPMRLRVWSSQGLQDVQLEKQAANINVPPGLVYPNAGDFGYGRFLLDAQSVEAVLAADYEPALFQAQLVEAVWESVREAELAPSRFLAYAIARLPRTRDDIALSGLLARMEAAFRRYLDDAQRDAIAPALERALRTDNTPAGSSRNLLLTRAFIGMAWSPAALQELKWLIDQPGLASRDRFRAVQRLSTRGDPQAPALLARQAAADPSDDGRRYAFAVGAADAGAKQRLFRAFTGDKALAESWIEAALGAFNAPEQAALTLPMLSDALAQLPELKRSRKIFFVNHWLESFLGGQTDARALADAEAFLRRGNIDADLRLKLLEAMDGLERAVRIRKKFAAPSAQN